MTASASLAAALSLAPASLAQTRWTFDDTLQRATDVVVADILNSSATADGADVHEHAVVRVERVLLGDLPAGSELTLDWTFPADFSVHPEGTAAIAAKGALIFLDQRARDGRDARYQPLQCGEGPSAVDRYLMSARKAAPTDGLAYTEETPLESKVAREEAAILEAFSAKHPSDPAQDRNAQSRFAAGFTGIAGRLRLFHSEAVAGVYRYFADSPDIYLRTFGLEGLVRNGDASALVAIEEDVSRLAPAFHMLPLTEIAMSVNPGAQLPAAHALARLALNEANFGNLDGMLAGILGRTGTLEVLPYLMAMLHSPSPFVSDASVLGICGLLRSGELWTDETAAHCPTQSPLNDRDQSQANHRFWLDWWGMHRDEIGKTVNLPSIALPSRYSAAPDASITSLPPAGSGNLLAIRFGQMLHTSSDPVFDAPADQQIFAALKREARKHAEEHMREDRMRVNQAREKHIALEPGTLEAGYEELVAAELANVRRHLSPGGWLNLKQALTSKTEFPGTSASMPLPR